MHCIPPGGVDPESRGLQIQEKTGGSLAAFLRQTREHLGEHKYSLCDGGKPGQVLYLGGLGAGGKEIYGQSGRMGGIFFRPREVIAMAEEMLASIWGGNCTACRECINHTTPFRQDGTRPLKPTGKV